MRILADFLDPGGNGFDVADAAILLTFIIAGTSAMYGAAVFALRQLREEITDVVVKRTQPLVSGYRNDGNSLTDISNRVELIADRQSSIGREIRDLRTVNDAQHEALGLQAGRIGDRLDDHAASPVHTHDTRSRSTDLEEVHVTRWLAIAPLGSAAKAFVAVVLAAFLADIIGAGSISLTNWETWFIAGLASALPVVINWVHDGTGTAGTASR